MEVRKALGILQILPNFKLKEEKISKMIDHNEMIFRKLYVNLPVGSSFMTGTVT